MLNSNENFQMDDTFHLSFVHVRAGPYGGGKKRKYLPGHQSSTRLKVMKKTVIAIPQTDENLCCARALVSARAKAENHPKRRSFKRGLPLQLNSALELHQRAGVRPGPCGADELHQFVQPPLQPREAFFGGRTNVVQLHRTAAPGEEIRYYDYTSLYPWVNKNARYPVGHPEFIYTPDTVDLHPYFGWPNVPCCLPPACTIPSCPIAQGRNRSTAKEPHNSITMCCEKKSWTSCTPPWPNPAPHASPSPTPSNARPKTTPCTPDPPTKITVWCAANVLPFGVQQFRHRRLDSL